MASSATSPGSLKIWAKVSPVQGSEARSDGRPETHERGMVEEKRHPVGASESLLS